MGRQKNPKGKIFSKKDEKLLNTLSQLTKNCTDDELVDKFKELYPSDWGKVVKRYNEHERKTPQGKSHPMPRPYKYIVGIFNKYRSRYRNGETIDDLLTELNTPKPKFVEETPPKLDKWLKQLSDIDSYENRIDAINKLGKFKCPEVIDAFTAVMDSDKVTEVRELAHQRLVRFGLDVPEPERAETYTDPDITQKLLEVAGSLKIGFSYERFESRFRSKYPEEFDLQKYTKKNRFKSWLKNQMSQLPKT
ncbi:HEAT repeat domain-containing protein (plasmid) [Vibrio metschnikovii]|uniref:HEAT repeat domain-containing protein n=1 Tax=Vibrio metschnikovii TaxID=28172 RepID=UPI003318D2BC